MPPVGRPWIWRWLKCHYKAWRIARNTRVLNHSTNLLRKILLQFPAGQIVGQPLPACQRTDDRYELLAKLQGVLRSMHIEGILVLVDRVDEPYLINGSTDLMRALVWPMLDNKFLKHPGLGMKLLLPIELERLIDREDRDFHQRARLDKQNLIRSLAWTGQSLYDMANARITACATDGSAPSLAPTFRPKRRPAPADRRLCRLARAAASVQVHVSPVYRPLQLPYRGTSGLADLQRHVRVGAGPVPARPRRLRSGRRRGIKIKINAKKPLAFLQVPPFFAHCRLPISLILSSRPLSS